MNGIICQNSNRFMLLAHSIADLESCRDFAFFTRSSRLLGRRGRTAARGRDRLDGDRFVSLILVLEMADRSVVSNSGVQFKLRLFPDEFGVRCGSKNRNDRSG